MSRTTYIYLSQLMWRILEWFCSLLIWILRSSAAVDSWRLGQRCIATVPLQPGLKQSEGHSFMSTHTSCAFIAANTVKDTARLLYGLKRSWERLDINIGLWNMQKLLTRKFSVAYCNAYSETNVVYKNRRYPQKLTFTDTAGPTDVLQ